MLLDGKLQNIHAQSGQFGLYLQLFIKEITYAINVRTSGYNMH